MTPARLREVLTTLRWSLADLAAELGSGRRLMWAWADGQRTVPPVVAAWLERLTAAHAAEPAPAEWRRPRGGARPTKTT
jgi:hypothetical protein